MRTLRVSLLALISLCLCFAASLCSAQASQDALNARLSGKTLYLRGLWAEDKLQFDAQGKPEKAYPQQSFSESGFQVQSVKLDGGTLKLEGQRMAVLFRKDQTLRVVPMRGKVRRTKYDGHVRIEIRGKSGQDFGPALDAVFAPDIPSLAPSVPEELRAFVSSRPLETAPQEGTTPDLSVREARPGVEDAALSSEDSTNFRHISGAVKPPVVIHQPEPVFSNTGRMLKYSGETVLYLWVDEQGKTSHLRVVKAAGAGLDEMALAAAKQYIFTPATLRDKPVKVDLYINVNFQIY